MNIVQKWSLPSFSLRNLPGDLGEPVVEGGEDAHDTAAEQHVVDVRDDPVRAVHEAVDGQAPEIDAVDAADQEHQQEAAREEHGRVVFDAPSPHRRQPVEDLHPCRHADDKGREGEEGLHHQRQAGDEHVVHEDDEPEHAIAAMDAAIAL